MPIAERTKPEANGHGTHLGAATAPLNQLPSAGSYSRTLLYLAAAAGALGLVSGATGLLWQGSGGTRSVRTVQGSTVEVYGRGLYENDSVFVVGNNFASDLVMVFLAVPLLAIAARMYVRGSLRGKALLLGALGYFVYYGASYALGAVAFNELFLVYVALFGASLFGLIAALSSFDLRGFEERLSPRWPGIFMLASGAVTLGIWLMEPVGALVSGDAPEKLETRTTLFTNAFDIAVIVPAALVAGALILRRRKLGYVVAFSLLVVEASLLPTIVLATIRQVRLDVTFETGEIVGPIAGFGIFAVGAVWALVALLRHIAPRPLEGAPA